MDDITYKLFSGKHSGSLDAHEQAVPFIGIICLRGNCNVTVHSEMYSLTDCMILILPPSPSLSLDSDGVTFAVTLPSALGIQSSGGQLSELPPLEAGLLADVFLDHRRSIAHQQAAVELVCHQLSHGPEKPTPPLSEQSLVETVTTYLESQLESRITLDDIVRQFSFSKSHICRQFQVEVGASPMLVLARLRIKRSKQLLAETDLTISQIGYAVSYSSVSSFSHFFSKHTELSPREYRENVHWLV